MADKFEFHEYRVREFVIGWAKESNVPFEDDIR